MLAEWQGDKCGEQRWTKGKDAPRHNPRRTASRHAHTHSNSRMTKAQTSVHAHTHVRKRTCVCRIATMHVALIVQLVNKYTSCTTKHASTQPRAHPHRTAGRPAARTRTVGQATRATRRGGGRAGAKQRLAARERQLPAQRILLRLQAAAVLSQLRACLSLLPSHGVLPARVRDVRARARVCAFAKNVAEVAQPQALGQGGSRGAHLQEWLAQPHLQQMTFLSTDASQHLAKPS